MICKELEVMFDSHKGSGTRTILNGELFRDAALRHAVPNVKEHSKRLSIPRALQRIPFCQFKNICRMLTPACIWLIVNIRHPQPMAMQYIDTASESSLPCRHGCIMQMLILGSDINTRPHGSTLDWQKSAILTNSRAGFSKLCSRVSACTLTCQAARSI